MGYYLEDWIWVFVCKCICWIDLCYLWTVSTIRDSSESNRWIFWVVFCSLCVILFLYWWDVWVLELIFIFWVFFWWYFSGRWVVWECWWWELRFGSWFYVEARLSRFYFCCCFCIFVLEVYCLWVDIGYCLLVGGCFCLVLFCVSVLLWTVSSYWRFDSCRFLRSSVVVILCVSFDVDDLMLVVVVVVVLLLI